MVDSQSETGRGEKGVTDLSLNNTDEVYQAQQTCLDTTSGPKATEEKPPVVPEGRKTKSGQHSKGNHGKKTKEKKKKSVRLTDGEHQNQTLHGDEVARRKSNLLLSDSAAAAALGNFVALQVTATESQMSYHILVPHILF